MGNKKGVKRYSYNVNNKYNQKHTEEEAENLFWEMFEDVRDDKEMLCVQDVYLNKGIPESTYYWLINNYNTVADIAKDIKAVLLSRINKGSLKGDLVSTPSIWRMKQLGEKDKQEVVNTNVDVPITEEDIKRAKKIIEEEDLF